MSFLEPSMKSAISILTYYFKLKSCFSGVLGYPGLAVVEELGSDDAMLLGFL